MIMRIISTFILAMSISIGYCQEPTTPAPTPPVMDAAKVISVYSNAYANGAGATDFNPNWGQSTAFSKVFVAGSTVGDTVLSLANINYQGFAFGNHIDASSMLYIHVDVWPIAQTKFSVFPIENGDAKEVSFDSTLTLNTWNSLDIPLSYFISNGINISDLFQFKFVSSVKTTVYLDNLYFYNNSNTVDNTPPTLFTANIGKVTPFSTSFVVNATDDSGLLSYAISYGGKTTKGSGKSGINDTIVVTGLTPGTNYSFSISAKDPTGNEAANSPIVFDTMTLVLATPLTSAPTPTALAADVKSIFSDAYTNIPGYTNYNAAWGQSTYYSKFAIAPGDTALELGYLTYQGIEFGSHVDASSLNSLHLDVWTADETVLQIYPICTVKTNGDQFFQTKALTLNAWNSINIPLTYFTGLGLNVSDVFQIKLVGSSTNKTVFVDNIYFYNNLSIGVAKIEVSEANVFPNPSSDNVTIVTGNSSLESIIEITNSIGQVVYSAIIPQGQDAKLVNVSNLSSGVYNVKIQNSESQIVKKLIKE